MTERELKAIGQGAKIIPITQGRFAIVDAADFETLNAHKWCGDHNASSRYAYAIRRVHSGNGPRCIISMHRQIMGPDGKHIDHINGDRLDNRRSNLRVATVYQNQWNRGCGKNNPTGFKGVSWCERGCWRASIRIHGVLKYLGRFKLAEDAARAYDAAAIRLHGEFACLNFPTVLTTQP